MISGSEHTIDEVITVVRKSVEAHQLKIAKDMEAKREEGYQPNDTLTTSSRSYLLQEMVW